ncbi:MAG: methyltransferase [Cyanobacteria bacterium J06649_5]
MLDSSIDYAPVQTAVTAESATLTENPNAVTNSPAASAPASAPAASAATEAPPGNEAINLLQMITGMWVTQSIYVVASLQIADRLVEGDKGVDELAQQAGCNEDYLYRVMRALAGNGIFAEVLPRRFALTPTADYLRSDMPGSLRSLALTISDEWQWDCFGDLLETVKTGRSAMQRQYRVQDTFEYLTEVAPASGEIFDDAMTGWASSIHMAILDSYDFSALSSLVDVAGGHGVLMTEILKRYSTLTGVVFDLPGVVAGADDLLAAGNVLDRCETVGGSFFEEIPAGKDAYMLSHILHDWSDQDCLKILNNIRQAMPDAGRLLVVEMLIPPGDTPHFGKLLDVTMLSIFSGGRERTEAEYTQLLAQAGFKVQRTVLTPGLVGVLEAVPA